MQSEESANYMKGLNVFEIWQRFQVYLSSCKVEAGIGIKPET